MEDYKEFSKEQVGAIARSIKLGRTLQKEHPEIAEMYIRHTQSEIADKLKIQSKYGVGVRVARNGIHWAINGHEGSFGIESYVGLMDKEEREWIGREHNVQNGQTAYEKGIGVHAQTTEELRELGQTTYEQGIGVHGRTAEQMREDSRKGNLARGLTPWSDEEKEFAYMLSQEQEYQHPNGRHAGKSNNELIAFALNMEYHDCKEVRSIIAVQIRLSEHRKSLVDIVV
jgi:hypothetical protein